MIVSTQPISGGTLSGRFIRHQVKSENLGQERGVTVRLPDNYDPENKTYPVIYLKDGQNMFDRRTGFMGKEWHVDETVAHLTKEGRLPEAILVAVDNGGGERLNEYSAVPDPRHGGGGGKSYESFFVEELLPSVEQTYSINPKQRVLLGSSMGGLVSLSLGMSHPALFAAVGALSPSVWWANGEMADRILSSEAVDGPKPKIWMDMGTEEGGTDQFGQRQVTDDGFSERPNGGNGVQDVRDRTREVGTALLRRGWTLDRDLRYHEPLGARHDEESWSSRIGEVLTWLMPKAGS